MKTDTNTTILELCQLVNEFVTERDWHKFHAPKNLAEAISVEAAELLQVFLWENDEKEMSISQRLEIDSELADIIILCLAMSIRLGADITTAVLEKMEKNIIKYPAEECLVFSRRGVPLKK